MGEAATGRAAAAGMRRALRYQLERGEQEAGGGEYHRSGPSLARLYPVGQIGLERSEVGLRRQGVMPGAGGFEVVYGHGLGGFAGEAGIFQTADMDGLWRAGGAAASGDGVDSPGRVG